MNERAVAALYAAKLDAQLREVFPEWRLTGAPPLRSCFTARRDIEDQSSFESAANFNDLLVRVSKRPRPQPPYKPRKEPLT